MGEALLGLRDIERDDEIVMQVRCPYCAVWGDIDADQLHGRVSTMHAREDGGCGWHVTVDWDAFFGAAVPGFPFAVEVARSSTTPGIGRVRIDDVIAEDRYNAAALRSSTIPKPNQEGDSHE